MSSVNLVKKNIFPLCVHIPFAPKTHTTIKKDQKSPKKNKKEQKNPKRTKKPIIKKVKFYLLNCL